MQLKHLIYFILLCINMSLSAQRIKLDPDKPIDHLIMVELKENTWIDLGEVTLTYWREYIYYNDPALYLTAKTIDEQTWANYSIEPHLLPDSIATSDYYALFKETQELGYSVSPLGVKIPLAKDPITPDNPHGRNLTYAEYSVVPIVGITYEQALDFCHWRTARDSTLAALYGRDNWYRFRLPTPEEYDQLSQEQDSLTTWKKAKDIGANYNYKGAVYRLNPKKKKDRFAYMYTGTGKRPVWRCHFYKDDNGICDLNGNVSEMTAVKGLAKGSNFTQYARESFPAMDIGYSKAEKWLGFRCIAERVWR